jgi:hypothetical protein
MWAQNLNLETEVVVIEAGEMEAVVKAGDYDVLRRGEVLPTVSETANLMAVFPPKPVAPEEKPTPTQTVATGEVSENADPTKENSEDGNAPGENAQIIEIKPVLTEEEAINELPAIPLYFPTTYSLVKPYVQGFEMNALDAPSLKNVRIDNDWKP